MDAPNGTLNRINKVIFGYMRLFESKQILFMNIAKGIISIIILFYPKIIVFHMHESNKFTLSNNNTEIKGNKTSDCGGYFV